AALALDPAVYGWLEGGPHAPEILREASRGVQPTAPLGSWPVTRATRAVRACVDEHGQLNARVVIAAQPRAGRKAFAASVADSLGLPAPLAVDTDRINEGDWDTAFRAAVRHAVLEGTSLVWHGDAVARRRWPDTGGLHPLHFVVVDSGVVPPSADEFIDERVDLPPPSMAERRALWTTLVPEAAAWPEHKVDELAARHRALPGEIAIVARHAPGSADEASALMRDLARERLGDLAERVETPFGMEDLVVEDGLRDSLEELMFEAKERPAFWEQPEARRMFPQGRGLLAMFSGAPGTGKTMAAQVVAADLGLDLFRIDLSSVVSKYVGETSQNLDRVLSRAAHMDAVLLFDEADALFGKRTEIRDAHDRFANTDTNYLLQAIESFQGVALLSTNKKGNVDPAFIRRLRYVLEFQKPDATQRRQIWARVLSALQGEETVARLRGQLDALAEDVEATGAQIKFAALNALFAARRDGIPVGLRHLVRGLERELGKEGRSLSNRERERLMRSAE
ncbi:MAG: ATP-binding protein, partial [Chloroflexota bacterium]